MIDPKEIFAFDEREAFETDTRRAIYRIAKRIGASNPGVILNPNLSFQDASYELLGLPLGLCHEKYPGLAYRLLFRRSDKVIRRLVKSILEIQTTVDDDTDAGIVLPFRYQAKRPAVKYVLRTLTDWHGISDRGIHTVIPSQRFKDGIRLVFEPLEAFVTLLLSER